MTACDLAACRVDDCDRPRRSRGLCNGHYKQALKAGALEQHPLKDELHALPVAQRFWPRVAVTPSCWLWLGRLNDQGYGTFRYGYAHRWSWAELVGPVEAGLTLDHLCRVRNCVNPDHLEPVTNAENIRRSWDGRRGFCKAGHDLAEHGYKRLDNGRRYCRTCNNERRRLAHRQAAGQ